MTENDNNGSSTVKIRIAIISAVASLVVALISLYGTRLVTVRSERSATEIEKLRHELTLTENRAKAASQMTLVQFERLHIDRARFIRSLYDEIVETERDLFDLLYTWRPIGVAQRQMDPVSVYEKVESLCLSTRKAGLYFSDTMVKKLESLCTTFLSTFRSMENEIVKVAGTDKPPEFDMTDSNVLLDECGSARVALRSEFSAYLGVQQLK